jgi:fructose-1,6-bisphosphatase I
MSLSDFLTEARVSGHAKADQIDVIEGLVEAAKAISRLACCNGLESDLGSEIGDTNAGGDSQKALDVLSEQLIIKHLKERSAIALFSEEQLHPLSLNENGTVVVVVDPLDGSSNISANVTVGTIFSLLPSRGDVTGQALQSGRTQLAAGFFSYGPQTTLIMTFAGGGDAAYFVLNPDSGEFVRVGGGLRIPTETNEFAVNSAYTHYWYPAMRKWMNDTQAGKTGPCGKDFTMRWVGSLVADASRIFYRGGVFLYPGNQRAGYQNGRLRLVYEANPMALLVERAGGMATDGHENILDLMPQSLHEHTPLFFGAKTEVERIQREHEKAG